MSPNASGQEVLTGLLNNLGKIGNFVGSTFDQVHILTADGWMSLAKVEA
jgi:hypothetical protein